MCLLSQNKHLPWAADGFVYYILLLINRMINSMLAFKYILRFFY